MYLKIVYKELTIIPDEESGESKLEKEYLHIWPRQELMLIGLPNPDNTFTCTIFSPLEGPNGIGHLEPRDPKRPSEEELDSIRVWFAKYFPDIPALIPNYLDQFLTNPTSPLKQINTRPWHLGSRICILGNCVFFAV